MHAHAQNVSVSYPFTLSQTDQIPFLFSAIPYQLIDDEVFGDLKGSHVKLILEIDRFRNLKLKQHKSDQVLLSGWTIAISQQVLADKCKLQRPTVNKLVEELIELGLLEKELVGRSKKYRYRLTFYGVTSQQVREMKSRKVEGIIQGEEMQRMKQEIEALKQRIDDVVETNQGPSDDICQENEQTCVEDSDSHVKDNSITSSSLADIPESQQLKFNQGASASPVTPHNASYSDDIRELTEYWYLHKKARCYDSHHQYRLHNFKGCVNALVADYNLNRQQAVDVLKVCIQLHVDTPDTPNWYIKHHQGLEYLNLAIAQVTDNPSMAEASPVHQQAKQQLHEYLRTYIQPLIRAGKQLDLKDILHHVNSRKPKLVQQLGNQQVQHILQIIFGNEL